MLGILRTVLFAPEDLALVRGDPSERRRFLDELLVLRAPRYAGVRADYDRVLRQRNALLKSSGHARRAGSKGDIGTLDVWDGHLARHGAELLAARLDLVARPGRPRHRRVRGGRARVAAGEDPATGRASPESFPAEYGTPAARADKEVLTDALLAAMVAARDHELDRGVSLVGPHRDELELTLADAPGQGLREPRRVVVVRARAAARRPTSCCVPTATSRCSCSTTCSPSSTGAAGSDSPRRRPRTPNKCS